MKYLNPGCKAPRGTIIACRATPRDAVFHGPTKEVDASEPEKLGLSSFPLEILAKCNELHKK